ncbi:hypothetical protein BU17DRAFT_71539 [Hysterangium stoloniferum]|nr:hypothetical protein BU17DRAFT_71539 [Hysterangium stoloniferum]
MLAYLLRFSYQFAVYLRHYIMSNENSKFLFHRENGTFADTRKTTKIPIIDASSCVTMDKHPDRITRTPRRSYVVVERLRKEKNEEHPGSNLPTTVPPTSNFPLSDLSPESASNPDIGSTKTSRKSPPRSLTDISVDASISSSSQDASDELQFSPDGTTAFLEPWREFETLESIDLRGIREPFTLSKLVTLVKVVRLQAVDYTHHNTEPMLLGKFEEEQVRRTVNTTRVVESVKSTVKQLTANSPFCYLDLHSLYPFFINFLTLLMKKG